MSEVALIIALAAVLGATPMAGQRIVGGLSAGAAMFLGLASAVFPDYESSLGAPLGVIAIIWAAAYLWTVLIRPGFTSDDLAAESSCG